MQYPPCFDDMQQYREWRASALNAKESVSPCVDCSPGYKHKMDEAGRCHVREVQATFRVRDSRTAVERFSEGVDE